MSYFHTHTAFHLRYFTLCSSPEITGLARSGTRASLFVQKTVSSWFYDFLCGLGPDPQEDVGTLKYDLGRVHTPNSRSVVLAQLPWQGILALLETQYPLLHSLYTYAFIPHVPKVAWAMAGRSPTGISNLRAWAHREVLSNSRGNAAMVLFQIQQIREWV